MLRIDQADERSIMSWIEANRPDVVIFVHLSEMLEAFRTVLKTHNVRVPADLGVAVLSHILDGSDFSGLEQNQPLMGAWAVELLAARISNRDLGIPVNPRVEMVESRWVQGRTLRVQPGK